MNVMALAAGLGTRLRPHTDSVPKPAIPFLGYPMSYYGIELLDGVSIDRFVVNQHHLPDQIKDLYLQLRFPPWRELRFSFEPQILGGGGAIRQAFPWLKGRGAFLVMNADEVILPQHPGVMKDLFWFHKNHKGIATFLCMQHPEVGTRFGGAYVADLQSGRIETFSKTPVRGLYGLHWVGVVLLEERIHEYFFSDPTREENLVYDTILSAIKAGESAYAYCADLQWFETGNEKDFLQATAFCLAELKRQPEAGWGQSLYQILNRYPQRSFFIEKNHPELLSGLKEYFSEFHPL
jgi:mannose-1-phosphate guanylyltransferase